MKRLKRLYCLTQPGQTGYSYRPLRASPARLRFASRFLKVFVLGWMEHAVVSRAVRHVVGVTPEGSLGMCYPQLYQYPFSIQSWKPARVIPRLPPLPVNAHASHRVGWTTQRWRCPCSASVLVTPAFLNRTRVGRGATRRDPPPVCRPAWRVSQGISCPPGGVNSTPRPSGHPRMCFHRPLLNQRVLVG